MSTDKPFLLLGMQFLYNRNMLDIKKLRENPKLLQEMLERRGIKNPWDDLAGGLNPEKFFSLEEEHRNSFREIENLLSRKNQIAEEFPKLKKAGKSTEKLSEEIEILKQSLSDKKEKASKLTKKFTEMLLRLPNFLHASVPEGKGPQENVRLDAQTAIPEFPFEARTHWEIGESLGILDFARAGKISGSRFSVLKGMGAALERALIAFMLDLHLQDHRYLEIYAPYLVNADSMQGTGQLPKFEEELFKLGKDELYLIPTAEVSVTNLHRDELFEESELPKKYVSYSACFRREAGSYGKDTKGLIRNHQFNKVELVWFTLPERSFEDLEKLTDDATEVLKKIGIPYRRVELCSGDTGFASAKTYDLEVWMPGEKRWREISSCSCFTDFQARRMNIKYKTSSGKKEFVHTLNGSGVAVGRLFAAILENYQEKDGSVRVPDLLQPYLKADRIR